MEWALGGRWIRNNLSCYADKIFREFTCNIVVRTANLPYLYSQLPDA